MTTGVSTLLFGVSILRERLDLARLASTGITLIGTVMLTMSR